MPPVKSPLPPLADRLLTCLRHPLPLTKYQTMAALAGGPKLSTDAAGVQTRAPDVNFNFLQQNGLALGIMLTRGNQPVRQVQDAVIRLANDPVAGREALRQFAGDLGLTVEPYGKGEALAVIPAHTPLIERRTARGMLLTSAGLKWASVAEYETERDFPTVSAGQIPRAPKLETTRQSAANLSAAARAYENNQPKFNA